MSGSGDDAESAARAWMHAYGIDTRRYTSGGGDHPMMDTLPAAFEAFAAARPAPAPNAGELEKLRAALSAAEAAITSACRLRAAAETALAEAREEIDRLRSILRPFQGRTYHGMRMHADAYALMYRGEQFTVADAVALGGALEAAAVAQDAPTAREPAS